MYCSWWQVSLHQSCTDSMIGWCSPSHPPSTKPTSFNRPLWSSRLVFIYHAQCYHFCVTSQNDKSGEGPRQKKLEELDFADTSESKAHIENKFTKKILSSHSYPLTEFRLLCKNISSLSEESFISSHPSYKGDLMPSNRHFPLGSSQGDTLLS